MVVDMSMICDFRAVFLPYLLKQMADGRYVVLNRNYKPIGFFTPDYVRYEDYPVAVRFKNLTVSKATRISCYGFPHLDEIILYDDATNPLISPKHMDNYMARLALLAKLKIIQEHDHQPPLPKRPKVA